MLDTIVHGAVWVLTAWAYLMAFPFLYGVAYSTVQLGHYLKAKQ